MRIEQKGLCRGDGKIFIKYRIDVPNGHTLRLSDSTKDGTSIPSNLISVRFLECIDGKKDYVAVIPNIPITQHLEFDLLDESENKIDSAVKKVNFETSKWESRFNYKVNKDLAYSIRNFDERWLDGGINITFPEILPADDYPTIVRCKLSAIGQSSENFEIDIYSGKMEKLPIRITDLGHKILTDKGCPIAVCTSEALVSFEIPDNNGYYLVVAKDSGNPDIAGFAALDPKTIRNKSDDWRFSHFNADIDSDYAIQFGSQRATDKLLEQQRNYSFELNPKYSIIVPLYETPLSFFDDMASSVLEQSYGNWELILVNASPDDEALAERVDCLAQTDTRVVPVVLDENLGISLNTRAGVDVATGDYICFFDHDDVLEPDILFEYASAINNDPNIDLLYCDEDRILPNGRLTTPYYKPEFSIDLLRSNNYICHLLCVRKSLLDTLEPSPKDVDGSQDHDLTLKVVEKSDNIHHVPRVLYHWRAHENSTASGEGLKPYARQAGVRAVQRHLDRLGIAAQVEEGKIDFTYDVRYTVQGNPKVSIIIPTKDASGVLRKCIDSVIEKTQYGNYEIILVENNSTEAATFEYYDELSGNDAVKVVAWDGPFNFSEIMNYGVNHSEGEYLLFLNNDTEVITPDWIDRMVGICQREDVGVVGAKLWYPDNVVQHAGVVIPSLQDVAVHVNSDYPRGDNAYFGLNNKVQNFSAVTGACMMTKRSVFERVGGFDSALAVAYNDIDYCLKVRELGLWVVYTPFVELYHYESLTRGVDTDPEGIKRFEGERSLFKSRWMDYYINGDPFYSRSFNPNSAFCELKK